MVKKFLWAAILLCGLSTGSLVAQINCPGISGLDQYCGYTGLHTTATGAFTTAQFGSRLMIVDPLGNAYFGRGADLTSDSAGTKPGNQIPYIGVYAYDSASTTYSANLNTPAAENITPNDVVNVAGVTAHNVNDAIYIGFARPFSMTYFNVNTLGVGGKIQWYYSATGGTWSLINGTGKPKVGQPLNGDGSYYLDIGNYIAPDANGFYVSGLTTANLVQWWTASGSGASYKMFPSDFATTTVNGSTALYYIKGVVTQQFTTSPKVGQLVDLTDMIDAAVMKYGVNGDSPSQIQRWYNRTMLRFQTWGLNLAPYDSYRLWQLGPANPTNRVPEIITWQITRDSMEGRWFGYTASTAVKDIYQSTGCSIYPGVHPDVFDPVYVTNMNLRAAADNTTTIDAWTIAVDPEEADALFGFDAYFKHAHLGVTTIFDNPIHPSGIDALGHAITFADTNLYSKFAIADMLRYEYKGGGDPIPAFTISSNVMSYYTTYVSGGGAAATTALANLNSAWNMHYSQWTSNGGWGTGTGFMDEGGTAATGLVSHITNGCSGLYPISFHTTPAAIATDLDAFEVLATAKYGSVMRPAVKAQAPNTMIALFLYQPPTEVAAGINPYIDFAEIAPQPVSVQYGGPFTIYQEGVRIYNALQKPTLYHDYHSANADSPMTFGGIISGLTYSGGQTAITWTGVPYDLRGNTSFTRIPEFPGSSSTPCTAPTAALQANWKTIWVNGDYTHCTSIGQPIRMYAGDYWVGNFDQSDTQALRGAAIVNEYTNYNALQGSDGKYFNAGTSHWAWNDDSAMSGSEWDNFGFVTAWDNAYDGVEAKVAVGHDSSGYFVGGEARDYGCMICSLSAYLLSLNTYTNLPGTGGGPPPTLTITSGGCLNGTVGVSYGPCNLTASGGSTPYTWSTTPSGFCPGLSLTTISNVGVISGTPTTPGVCSFTEKVTDNVGAFQTQPNSITINSSCLLHVTTTSFPSGNVNVPYGPQALSATCGTPPYTWALSFGSLPTGLGPLPSSGIISGTPTTPGSYPFTVKVTDALSSSAFSGPLSITIFPPAPPRATLGISNQSISNEIVH